MALELVRRKLNPRVMTLGITGTRRVAVGYLDCSMPVGSDAKAQSVRNRAEEELNGQQ